MKTNKLEFDLDVEELEVTLKKGGQPAEYVLRSLTGKGRDAYLNLTGKRMTYDAAGKPKGIKSFEGMQAELLQFCLIEKASNKAVTVEQVQEFPASVVAALFAEAQKMNALDAEAEVDAKKALEPESSGTGTE